MRANVYVDAFNLYYGCLKGTPYRWLNIATLCRRLLPKDKIQRIRYFTAIVDARGDPQRPARQQAYVRALRTLPNLYVHYGSFVTRKATLRLVKPRVVGRAHAEVWRTEEKGSDVNLATYLLLDAFRSDYEVAIVISNDADLKEPIDVVRRELSLPVGVVNPHPPHRRSRDLSPTFFKQIRRGALAESQFPAVLRDAQGEIRKPRAW